MMLAPPSMHVLSRRNFMQAALAGALTSGYQAMAARATPGAEAILLGCGDSGTNDGGAGMIQALGGKLLDAQGEAPPATLGDGVQGWRNPRLNPG